VGVAQVVKPKPDCRHCGAVLEHPLSRCPRCGKRSLLNLVLGGFGKKY
jgi:primosomal protein N'